MNKIYERMAELIFEARRLTGAELKDAALELVTGDHEVNWTFPRAKRAIRRAQAAGTPRLSKEQHKSLEGRGWSDKPAAARKTGAVGHGFSDSPGPLHSRHPGTGSIKDLIFHRAHQDRPEGYETEQDVRKLARAVDAGETPPAIATRDTQTGKLTQHGGRTRHTASKLTGGPGAEFAIIHPKDRYHALQSKLRTQRRTSMGRNIPPGMNPAQTARNWATLNLKQLSNSTEETGMNKIYERMAGLMIDLHKSRFD